MSMTPNGTGRDAGAAAIAGVRLDDDGVEFGADDGAGGTDLEARRGDAVLADVAHHEPAAVLPILAELLDELDVPPVDPVQPLGIVVAVAAHLVLAAASRAGAGSTPCRRPRRPCTRCRPWCRCRIPWVRGIKPSPRYRRTPCLRGCSRWDRRPCAVSVFTTSPVTTPSQPQCHGIPTWCTTLSPSRNGRIRRVTRALARIWARGVLIRTQSVFLIPFSRRKLGRELDEELRHQLGEPRVPAAHDAREVVLGQPVGGDHVGEARIADRGERVAVVLPVLEHRARSAAGTARF